MERLLEAWRAHDDNRRARAPIPELARTRAELDQAREVLYQLRRRLSPDPSELVRAPITLTCSAGDLPVTLRPEDLVGTPDGVSYRCVCGATAVVPDALVDRLERLRAPSKS